MISPAGAPCLNNYGVTDAEILAAAKTALGAILTGQASQYSVGMPGGGSRSFSMLNINDLRELIAEYEAKVLSSTRPMFAGIRFAGARG